MNIKCKVCIYSKGRYLIISKTSLEANTSKKQIKKAKRGVE